MLPEQPVTIPVYQQGDLSYTVTPQSGLVFSRHSVGGDGGRLKLESRIAKLESDVEYIKRDIAEIKSDVKSVDERLTRIETGIMSMKMTFKVSATLITSVFVVVTYIFGSYVSKIIDALNGLVLK
jgi:hypothetical protein